MPSDVNFGGKTITGAALTVSAITDFSDAPSDGGTYAREDGQWVDVAQAANLQLRRGTEAERVQITPLEGEPIYTTDSRKLYIGDGQTVGGNEIVSGEKAPQQNPPGMVRIVSIRDSGTLSINAKSTTGYVAARWWDGSVAVFGAGVAANTITVSKAVPTTGNWIKSAPKEIFIWSCVNADASQSGDLTFIASGLNSKITAIDVRGLLSLTSLGMTGDPLTSLDVRGLTALTSLNCGSNFLTELDITGLAALDFFQCDNSNIATPLNFTGMPAISYISFGGNKVPSLNISGLTSITNLDGRNNLLTSVRAAGTSLPDTNPVRLWSNSLSAAALNQFFTDLAPGNASIYVDSNPGAATADVSIATAKGYTVFTE